MDKKAFIYLTDDFIQSKVQLYNIACAVFASYQQQNRHSNCLEANTWCDISVSLSHG